MLLLLLNKRRRRKKSKTKSKQKQNKNLVVGIEGIWRLLLLFLISLSLPPSLTRRVFNAILVGLGIFRCFVCIYWAHRIVYSVLFLDVSFAWDSLPKKRDRQTKSDKRKSRRMELGNQIVVAYLVLFLLILLKLFFEKLYTTAEAEWTRQNGVQNAILYYFYKASTNPCCKMLIRRLILAADSSERNLF